MTDEHKHRWQAVGVIEVQDLPCVAQSCECGEARLVVIRRVSEQPEKDERR